MDTIQPSKDVAALIEEIGAAEQTRDNLIAKLGQMPMPPEELRMHVGARPTAHNFLRQGRASSRKVLSIFGESPTTPILDWGCGSGRTLRWLLAYKPWAQFYRGVDVDAQAIEWLQAQGVKTVKVSSSTSIDLPYQTAELGGLFSFSVLTHIHPQNFKAWLTELARVMKPGACAYLTFNGDRITEPPISETHPTHAADFGKQGWAWIDFSHKRGHYKSAAFASHDFVKEAAEGLFGVEKIVRQDYNNMDALYGTRL